MDRPVKINLEKLVVTPNWAHQSQPLSAAAGMHRFIWDLHYPCPDALCEQEPSDGEETKGLWALPGSYIIKLTVADHSYTQTFLQWAQAHGVGYAAWTWDTWGNCESLISSYHGAPAHDYGSWVRAYYAGTA